MRCPVEDKLQKQADNARAERRWEAFSELIKEIRKHRKSCQTCLAADGKQPKEQRKRHAKSET